MLQAEEQDKGAGIIYLMAKTMKHIVNLKKKKKNIYIYI
jgi:hypothetical protein